MLKYLVSVDKCMAKNIRQVLLFKIPLDILFVLRQKDELCYMQMVRINKSTSMQCYKEHIKLFLKKRLVTFSTPKGIRKYYSLTIKGRKLADLFYELNELLKV